MYIYSYATTEGIVKKINQDALMIKIARYKDNDILFSAVCDGIGGLTGGENASSFVINKAAEWFGDDYPDILREGKTILDARKSLDKHLHRINDAINICSEKSGGMGTTLTALLIDPFLDSVMIAHVGDTRLYKIYEDRIEAVTSDHSIVAEEVRRGLISEESARFDKRQIQITNCIGAGETGRMYDYMIQKPETDCMYMICSDGFRKMVSDEEIHQRLLPSANSDRDTLKSNLEYLMKLNMERNEADNITALAVRYAAGENDRT
jgi:serine/threonine protein phosphatase PrpC